MIFNNIMINSLSVISFLDKNSYDLNTKCLPFEYKIYSQLVTLSKNDLTFQLKDISCGKK